MSSFWKRWLSVWCLGVVAFGLVLYGAGFAATTAPAAEIFAAFGTPLPADPDRYLRFAISLMGAVTCGWGVTFYAAFRAAWSLEPARSAGVWRILTIAAAAWYVIDSSSSVANGFAVNAVSNSLLVAAYLIPVVASGVLRADAVDRSI